jgi:hypothetical protein
MKRNGDVMRSDRLKQVMQEIDPDFDEKDLGHPKFSRFCLEAAQRGLLAVTKLENGQLEVDLPREKAASAPPRRPAGDTPVVAPSRDQDDSASEDRGRPRRGRGRGRGRERGDRPPRPDTEPRTDIAASIDSETTAEFPVVETRAIEPETRAPREGRPPHDGRPPRDARPPRESGRPPAAPSAQQNDVAPRVGGPEIGVSGERLTKDEAFNLVRRAVDALTSSPEDVVRASEVRVRARDILGRDSQTLAEHYFGRILRDAHDANVIDLRRRGDDFEVARAADAAPVAEQLSRAAAAAPPAMPSGPPAPRGMGPRGGGPGRGGRGSFGARVGAPPPDLLSIGVVDTPSLAPARDSIPAPLMESAPPAVGDAETVEEEQAAPRAATKRGARARPAAGRAAKKSASKAAAAPEAKPRRARAKKTARTSDE